jgi:hypothetical protein
MIIILFLFISAANEALKAAQKAGTLQFLWLSQNYALNL